MGDVQVNAVCDIHEDRMEKGREMCREKYGREVYGSVRSHDVVIRDDLDAVLITTYWNDHVKIAIDAMRHGKYAAFEVGPAQSIQQCWDLVHTYEETGVPCMLMENCCYNREEMTVLNMIKKGLFGEVLHCQGGYQHDLRAVAGGMATDHERTWHHLHRNAEVYPTHELGPIMTYLDINHGNRLLALNSMATKSRGLAKYVKDHFPEDHPLQGVPFRLGDIVTANLHTISRGQARLTAVDFYDPEMKQIDIPLNPAISPQQNAAKFYKDYQKAKTAEKVLTEQIARGETELQYLSSVLDELSRAESERDIQEIRQELTEGGYLRETGQKKKMKLPASRPMVFRSSDGFEILVGRNNRQNDLLTCKMAQKQDIWLHTQKIHGSHVIIACAPETPPDRTVTEAMQLAAYFSQAREGQNVPVDYTRVKNVKKPAGAKPGMVVYDHYATAVVTPDASLIEKLKEG